MMGMRSRRWKVGGLRPYLGDTHVHSRRSDGSLEPEELSYHGAGLGLDFLAITDHDRDPLLGTGTVVMILPGTEFSLGHRWHMVALGQRIPGPRPEVNQIPEWAEALHDEGGALILAHPWTMISRREAVAKVDDWLNQGVLDGVELLNTAVRGKYVPEWAEMFRVYLEKWLSYHPAVIGGSDYHDSNHGKEVGLGCTYIFAEQSDPASLIAAVRQRRTVAIAPRPTGLREDCRRLLPSILPEVFRLGIGPPDLQLRLEQYRSLAETIRTPRAAWALWSGNYRLALEIQEEESR